MDSVTAFDGAFVVVFAVTFAGIFGGAFALALGLAILRAGAVAFGVVVFVFLTAGALSLSVTFLLVPAVAFVSALATGGLAAGLLFVAPFFASRSFFVHSFLSFV